MKFFAGLGFAPPGQTTKKLEKEKKNQSLTRRSFAGDIMTAFGSRLVQTLVFVFFLNFLPLAKAKLSTEGRKRGRESQRPLAN